MRLYLSLFSLTFVLLYALTLLFAHNYKHLYENPEFAMWQYIKDMANNKNDDKLDFLVMGDSRIKAAFKPAFTKLNTLNLSLGGATPIEGYFSLNAYLKNNPVPDSLVLSYTPYHLMFQDAFWSRSIAYNFLNLKEYLQVKEQSRILGDTSLRRFHRWEYYFLGSKYFSTIIKGLYAKRYESYDEIYQQMQESRGHIFFGKDNGSSARNYESYLGIFAASLVMDHYLQKTIALAKDNNIDVYWYTVPFNESSCKKLAKRFKHAFNKYLKSFDDDHITVINGINCLDDKYFGDHLGHPYKGTKKITQRIVRAIFPL